MIKEIIIVTFSLSNNGAERVFSELANEWAIKGYEVRVVQFEENIYGSQSFELSKQVQLLTLNRKGESNKIKRYLGYILDIRKILKSSRSSIVIAFSFITQVIVSIASFGLKNKIIFSERNDPNNCPYSSVLRLTRNFFFHRPYRIVFQTQDAKAYFSRMIQRKGVIIENPINPLLPELFQGERRKVVITAARLRPQKNLALLIESFSLFNIDFPEYHLEIYGIGEQEKELKELASKKGISDHVHFMGFSSDVNNKMRDASIYVCSSDYEGISNSLLEAMGMGVPTISTDCPIGGSRQVIQNNENGILVPVKDEMALYEAMKKIAGDPNLSKRLSMNGYMVRELYNIDTIATRWIKIFNN